jgi:CRISPR-associated endonuclease/helicase Cas3
MHPTLDSSARAIWAKTDIVGSTDRTHPLACHIIDTASVAEQLWARMLSSVNRRSLSASLNLTEDEAKRWAIFLAAIHDLGKACPGFQAGALLGRGGRSRQQVVEVVSETLRRAGLPLDTGDILNVRHAQVSYFALVDDLDVRGVPFFTALRLAEIVGGHHGMFLEPTEMGEMDRPSEAALTNSAWIEARHNLVDLAAEVAGIDWNRPPAMTALPVIPILTGIVTVADWIASDEKLFPYQTRSGEAWSGDVADYLAAARRQAEMAFTKIAWFGDMPDVDEARTFRDLWPERDPRPFQTSVERLAGEMEPPALLIVEAPTGEGKTEAAITAADNWGIRVGHRGLYFALPTRATSDALAERLFPYLGKRYAGAPVGANILHGRASLSAALETSRHALDGFYPASVGDRPTETVVTGRWFGGRRRGLLAPFGAGTVDQALMATVGIKWSYVLMAALAGKTVVFDEVHAYDAVMEVRFLALLRWLGALGASAIVLSATLPDHQRRAFAAAFAAGARFAKSDPGYAPYPRITAVSANVLKTETVAPSARQRAEVRIHLVDTGTTDDLTVTLMAPEDAGCLAIICHSVRQAQETHDRLRALFPGNASDGLPIVDSFHARFPERDKEARRQRIMTRFGPPIKDCAPGERNPDRPTRAILVATQIIEQSLDLDFDALITPLAPIDLLIQRIGRVQRHAANPRPARFAAGPEVWITRTVEGELPVFPDWETNMYSRHRLLRTFWTLRSRMTFSDLSDPEVLVEAVYATDTEPAAQAMLAARTMHEAALWASTLNEETTKDTGASTRARGGSIPTDLWKSSMSKLSLLTGREREPQDGDEDPESDGDEATTATRDGGSSLTIVLLSGWPEDPRLALDHGVSAWTTMDTRARPSTDQLRGLLDNSVTVRYRPDFDRLRSLPGWDHIPMLSRAKALFIGVDTVLGRTNVLLRPDVGLVLSSRSQSAAGDTRKAA